MPTSATNTFKMTGLVPAVSPWQEARRINVKLPASVSYLAGCVLGEVVGADEVQTLTLTTGGTLGGTYTLTFAGATTSALAYNASASTVQTAMEALSTIGVNNISVTGTTPTTAGGTLSFTFRNALGKQNVIAMTADATSLTGTTPGAAIATGTAGTGTANEVQTIYTTGGTVSGGTFTVTYSGQTTASVAYNVATADLQTALENLSNLQPGDVTVSGTAGSIYILKFGGTLAATDVSAVTITNSVTGGGSYAVATATAGQAGSWGTYKAYLSSATDGSGTAKAILEFDAATDSSGNITLGTASGGGDKGQTALGNTVSAFVSGTFKAEDCQQTSGAGQLTATAITDMGGHVIQGSVQQGLFRIG